MIISILFILSVIVAVLNDLLMVIRFFNILRVIRIVLTSCFVSCQDIYICTAVVRIFIRINIFRRLLIVFLISVRI